MKKMFLLIMISLEIYGQTQIGTLQRINFVEKTIIQNDTIGTWVSSQNKFSMYDDAFTYTNKLFLVDYQSEKSSTPQNFRYYYSTLIRSNNYSDTLVKRVNVPEDLNGPYHQNHTIAIRSQNKWILLNSWAWTSHVLSYDNTISKFNIEEIKDVRHVTRFRNNVFLYVLDDVSIGKARFYIKDFNEFNSLTKEDEVFFDKSTGIWSPFKIIQLKDSLYLVEQEWDRKSGLHMVTLMKDTFSGSDTVHYGYPNTFGSWIYKAPYLFYSNSNNLFKRKYDEQSNKFLSAERIVPNFTTYKIDQDEKFMFSIFRDTLKVFSLEEQKVKYKLFLDKSYYYFQSKIIVEPPFIYLHKLLETTNADTKELPSALSLSQNYPNPFNPETTISYKVQAASKVSLKVYDLLGREVATLVDEYKQPGSYTVAFNVEARHGVSLQSGVYFYRLQAGSFSETKKMILLK